MLLNLLRICFLNLIQLFLRFFKFIKVFLIKYKNLVKDIFIYIRLNIKKLNIFKILKEFYFFFHLFEITLN